jgi:hypothetical protein
MLTRLTVLSMLALAVLGVLLWGGPVTNLWARAFAAPCPAAMPAPDCVAELPAHVTKRWDSIGDGETTLSLDIPDTPTADLALSDANRLGLRAEDDVRVTVFAGEVIAVSSAGRTAATNGNWVAAALRYLAASGVAILAVALAARRFGHDPRRAAVCTVAGTLVGLAAGCVVPDTLAMPVTFAVAAVASVVASFVLPTRPLTNPSFT